MALVVFVSTGDGKRQANFVMDVLDPRIISARIQGIKAKFEDDISAVMKHHDKWKANHNRRLLKESLVGKSKFPINLNQTQASSVTASSGLTQDEGERVLSWSFISLK